MLEALICERYGWTHEEYQNQPSPFLKHIEIMLQQQGIAKDQAQKR